MDTVSFFIALLINFGLTVIGIFVGLITGDLEIVFNKFIDKPSKGKYKKKELRIKKIRIAFFILVVLSLVLGLLTFCQSERESERTKEAINISLSNIPLSNISNSLEKVENKVDRLIKAKEGIEDDSFQINE